MKIKDIAAMSGTSVATVSRVINGDERVRPDTKRRVLEVIEQTGYKPNMMGRNLRRLKSWNILLLLPTITNPIYSQLMLGVEEKARENGYDVIVAVTNRDSKAEKKYLEMLYTKEVDGAVTCISFLDDGYLAQAAQKFPLVLCCGSNNCEHLSYTCINNELAVYDAAKYLLKLGHRRIARISTSFALVYEEERKQGFARALREAGVDVREEYLFEGGFGYQDGYRFTERLMQLPEPPTAIVAFSDIVAAGCIKYLNEHGLEPGVDVDVVGFDDIEVGEIVTPALTTVSQPLIELGRTSMELLLEKMKDIGAVRKAIILDHKLVVRGSTRSPEARG